MILLDRLIDIRQRLGLYALTGVNDQQGALASRKTTTNLVGKIDMSGRIHQIERIGLTICGGVVEPDGLRFNGNAALPLNIHRVENLFGHFPVGQRTGCLNKAIGKGGFTMVDMGHDGEISDMVARCHSRRINSGLSLGKRSRHAFQSHAFPTATIGLCTADVGQQNTDR
ncbi:MAG: Uncharacterised protein [Hyphomonas sp. TMED17]|nr:MAG: Uncharacterised protein [Hyphomonas sp. TMED17]